MNQLSWRRAGCAIALAAALLAPNIACAQTVGASAVTALQSLCGPYMSGTPFDDAATLAGFGYDEAIQEYYFCAERAISTTAQVDAAECKFVVYFTDAEDEDLLAALIGFANSIEGRLTRDGDCRTDAEFQYWITEWQAPGQSLTLTEMQHLDGTLMVEGFDVMVVTLRRTQ